MFIKENAKIVYLSKGDRLSKTYILLHSPDVVILNGKVIKNNCGGYSEYQPTWWDKVVYFFTGE